MGNGEIPMTSMMEMVGRHSFGAVGDSGSGGR